VLHLHDVRLRLGSRILFENASATLLRGEKIGLVGRNGSGKSSLLALLRGELKPDSGDVEVPPRLTIAAVAQNVPASSQSVVDYICDGDEELRGIERAVAAARAADDGEREALLHLEFERVGGYTARSRAAALASGLGFEPRDVERPLDEFSGGLRMRASLARALMRRSDLLLLDEPTNHLDLDAVLWLEGWLGTYRGTLIVVSHDREFLDAVVERILLLEDARLLAYGGNYSTFERLHADARARLESDRSRQEREIARVQGFVQRFRASASKARQAQSRLKWLARLAEIPPLADAESFEWAFETPGRLPRPLLTLDGVAAGYGERRVLAGIKLELAPGDRLGILGRNGAGKSTLMRVLAGTQPALAGTVVAAPEYRPGFFAQLELEQLDPRSNALQELARRAGPPLADAGEQARRDHLGRFGFRGDRVFEPVAQFSGGEKARLTLAILVARRPNVLLLDEPTNHLDFDMRRSLLLALQEFAGALVVVSHDRSLLRGACDRFCVVGDGRVTEFDGDLEDYASWLAARRSGSLTSVAETAGRSRRDERRVEAEARNRLTGLRSELRRIETALERLGAERGVLEQTLADPALYTEARRAEQKTSALRHAALASEIEAQEARWLELTETLEKAGGPLGPPEGGSHVRTDA